MAKELNFNNLNIKKPVTPINVEKAVELIHAPVIQEVEKESIKRISLNVAESKYEKIREHCFRNRLTITDYLISLIDAHLGK